MNASRASALVLGVDLGGTRLRARLEDASGRCLGERAAPTAKDSAAAVVRGLGALCAALVADAGVGLEAVSAAGVGVPGVHDARGGELRLATNLPAFAGARFEDEVRAQLGMPVVIDNDVNMAALGEQAAGSAAGRSDFVFIAVGTGVGMGIVAGGRLLRGATGAAGEIAWMPIGADAADPGVQVRGALETAVGGASVAERLRAGAAAAGPAPDAYALALDGDAHAAALLRGQARALALAIVAVQSVLDPELVVLGGGMGAREDLHAAVTQELAGLAPRPLAVIRSALGERAGLVGAAAAARARVQSDGHVPLATERS